VAAKKSVAVSHDLRIIPVLMTLNRSGDINMDTDFQLVGKTITGIVATPGKDNDPHRIWMLQFSDGSHVEFVSPSARRRLNRVTGGHKRTINAFSQADTKRVNAA
jgi:hypothetical protein